MEPIAYIAVPVFGHPRKTIQVSRAHITCSQYSAWLNTKVGRRAVENQHCFNTANTELPICYQSGGWRPRSGFKSAPAVGMNVLGAALFAAAHNARLMSTGEWRSLLKNNETYKTTVLEFETDLVNTGDTRGGITSNSSYPRAPSGFLDLFGNARCWGIPDPQYCCEEIEGSQFKSFPTFGCAWNKSFADVNDDMIAWRWGYTGSVGVGFRCIADS